MFKKKVAGPDLKPAHLYFVDEDGTVKDLGPATLPDIRFAATVAQIALHRLKDDRHKRLTTAVLTRNNHFMQRIFNNANTPE